MRIATRKNLRASDSPVAGRSEPLPRLLISAAHKSSGKTTVSIGLAAALRARGLIVQTCKKGPDYIDPLWLSLASGRDCHNLDFYLSDRDEIVRTLATQAVDAHIALIEGNKGLYDGLDLDGSNSNAALAHLLQTPVVLVVDARGMTRGVAPLILGYQQFDPGIRIAGVILNRLGGSRHEAKLRAVIEHYTEVPVLGAVHEDPRLGIDERHLGLIPSNETDAAAHTIASIAEAVADQVDLDTLRAIADSAPPLPRLTATARTSTPRADVRIGVARDAAFAFYYPGDLTALRAAGAELVMIDTLHDSRLPPVDGLFIGGGFPETHMHALEANVALRRHIRAAIAAGMPVYAECGGLMYLARRISWGARSAEMVGAIPGDIIMHERPVGRGYVVLRETGLGPWTTGIGEAESTVRAHEFHYSSVVNLPADTRFAYEVLRGHGVNGRHDGIIHKNVLASYTHLRNVAASPWATHFVQFVRSRRDVAATASF